MIMILRHSKLHMLEICGKMQHICRIYAPHISPNSAYFASKSSTYFKKICHYKPTSLSVSHQLFCNNFPKKICFLGWMNLFSILARSAEWHQHHPYRAPQECFLSPTMALVGPASEPPAIRLTLTWPLQWTHRVVIVYYSVRVILPFLSIHRDTPSANCQGQMLTALATETHFSNFCHNWLMTKPTVFIYNV